MKFYFCLFEDVLLNKQRLTGGDLLARDEYFITLYRGNDFLPQQVASALAERSIMLSSQKVREDDGIEIQPNKTPTIGKQGLTENIAGIERKSEESRHFLLAQSLEAKLAIVSNSHDYIILYAEFACACFP